MTDDKLEYKNQIPAHGVGTKMENKVIKRQSVHSWKFHFLNFDVHRIALMLCDLHSPHLHSVIYS